MDPNDQHYETDQKYKNMTCGIETVTKTPPLQLLHQCHEANYHNLHGFLFSEEINSVKYQGLRVST